MESLRRTVLSLIMDPSVRELKGSLGFFILATHAASLSRAVWCQLHQLLFTICSSSFLVPPKLPYHFDTNTHAGYF